MSEREVARQRFTTGQCVCLVHEGVIARYGALTGVVVGFGNKDRHPELVYVRRDDNGKCNYWESEWWEVVETQVRFSARREGLVPINEGDTR